MKDSDEITYGSLIMLRTNLSDCITSKGFIDNSLYVTNEENIDFCFSVFQILPQCIYSTQQDILKKILKHQSAEPSEFIMRKNDNLEGEFKTNMQTFIDLKGIPLKYGSFIQLLHVKSQKFLTHKSGDDPQNAEIERENLKLTLEDYASELSHFRIDPSLKFQLSRNGVVNSGDKVALVGLSPHLSKNLYVHLSEIPYMYTIASDMAYRVSEVNASLDNKTDWEIKLFAPIDTCEKRFIEIGESIWIIQSEKEESIVAAIKTSDKYIAFDKYRFDSNGLWTIESLDSHKGGKLHKDTEFRLKHLISGKYLVVDFDTYSISQPQFKGFECLKLGEKDDSYSIWSFIPIYESDESLLPNEGYFRLYNTASKLYLTGQDITNVYTESNLEVLVNEDQDDQGVFKLIKADDLFIWTTTFLQNCLPILHAFPAHQRKFMEIIRPSVEEIRDMDKLMSITLKCLDDLILYCRNKLPSMMRINKQYGEVQLFRQNILREQFFIEALVSILDNLFADKYSRNKLNKIRQETEKKVISDDSQTYSEDYIVASFSERSFQASYYEYLIKVTKKVYELIKTLSLNNSTNQEYTFKFFNIFRRHAGLELGATDCLLSIISNNENLLLKLHQPDSEKIPEEFEHKELSIIEFYVKLLVKYHRNRKPYLLNFLRSVCSYKGQGLSINQEKVFELVIDDYINFDKIMIPMKLRRQNSIEVEIYSPSTRSDFYVSLNDFLRKDSRIYTQSQLEYFRNQLGLLADICLGRNKLCIEAIKGWFPIEKMHSLLWSASLSTSIRACIVRLIICIHADCYPREVIVKPELIKLLKLNLQGSTTRMNLGKFLSHVGVMGSELIGLRDSIFTEYEPIPQISTDISYNPYNFMKLQSQYRDRDCVPISSEELPIYRLADDLLMYFNEVSKIGEIDELTYELINMAKKFVMFEIYSDKCIILEEGVAIAAESKILRAHEMGIIRITSVLIKLLLSDITLMIDYNTFSSLPTDKSKASKLSQQLKSRFLKNYHEMQSSETTYCSNPIRNKAVNLKNFLNSICLFEREVIDDCSFESKAKEEICEIINLYLDWRLDFLIYNVIEWFNLHDPYLVFDQAEIKNLLPNIMNVGSKISTNEYQQKKYMNDKNQFKNFIPFEIYDLNVVFEREILPYLTKSFSEAKNIQLQSKLLNLIIRCYTQRKELIKAIKKLHMIADVDEANVYAWAKLNISRLREYCIQSKVFIKNWNYSESINPQTSKFNSILKILEHIRYLLHQDSFIVYGHPSHGLGPISSDRQLLLYYLGLHTCLINFIKDSSYMLIEVYQEIGHEIYSSKIHFILSECYNLLRELTYKNSVIQNDLHSYIPFLSNNLEVDVNQIQLCCAIYKDNLELCSSLSEEDLKPFINAILVIGRYERFLQFFEVLIVVKGNPILSAQRLVLNALFGKDAEYLLMLKKDSDKDKKFKFEFKERKRMIDLAEKMSTEALSYHAKLIHLLSICCLGSTNLSLNEAKCQKWIQLEYLFELLEKCENPENSIEILKIPLLEFLYHAYIDIEKKYEDLKAYQKFLEYIVFQTALLNGVEELTEKYVAFIKIWLRILIGYSERYIINYDWNYADEDLKLISEYVLALVNNSYKLTCKLDMDTFVLLHKLCEEHRIDLTQEDMDNLVQESLDSSINQTSQQKPFNHILERWHELREIFLTSNSIRKLVIKEKKRLKYYLFNVSEYIVSMDLDLIVKILVNFVRQSKINNLNHETIIYALKLLSNVVENPFPFRNETEKDARLRIQNMFLLHDACKVALTLKCDYNIEAPLFKSLLKLSVFMLEGGNVNIQQECYEFFISVPTSQNLFFRLNNIITDYIDKSLELSQRGTISAIQRQETLIKFVLRYLQLLCENHNQQLQNYLRVQTHSKISYNLVDKTIKLLETLMKNKFSFSFASISQCFDTLSEMIQGPCWDNQKVLMDSRFLDIASGFLSIDDQYLNKDTIIQCLKITALKKLVEGNIKRLEPWMISHLKYKCLITIHGLLEGSSDLFIITRLSRAFDIEMLKQNLYTLFQAYKNNYGLNTYQECVFKNFVPDETLKKIKHQLDFKHKHLPVIENGFMIFFLMKYFVENGVSESDIADRLLPESNIKSRDEYGVGDIVLQKLESLGVVLYTRGPSKRIYDEENADIEKSILKEAFNFFEEHTGNIEVVFTDDIISKVYFPLPPEASALTIEIKEQFEDEVDRSSYKNKLQSLINLAPNVIQKIRHENTLNKIFNSYKILKIIANNHKLFKDLAFVNCIVINLLILGSYSSYKTSRLTQPSLFYYESDMDGPGLDVEDTSALITTLGVMQCIFSVMIVSFYLIKAAPVEGRRGWNKVPIYRGHLKQPKLAAIIQQSIRAMYAVLYVLNVNVLFYISYLYMALCGVFIHPFFFAYHLLEILYRFPSLQNVVKSVSVPAKSLFLTFLFTLVLIYIFGLLGYYWYYEYFKGNCPSLFICFLNVIDKGFKSNGGIGGYLTEWKTGTIFFGRYLYDNLYNIVIMIIMLNIVQGIIIDTFAVLRERSDAKLQDKENVCFICNVDKATMERKTDQDFHNHRRVYHNEFNYIFFIDHLLSKDPVDYTGIESHVRQGYEKGDINWFPQKRALAFKQGFENDEDLIKDKQDIINEKLTVIDSKINELLRKPQ